MIIGILMSYYETTWAMIDPGYEWDRCDTSLRGDDLPEERHLVVVDVDDIDVLAEVRRVLRVTRSGHVPMVRRREHWESVTIQRAAIDAIVVVVIDPSRAAYLQELVRARKSGLATDPVVRVTRGHTAPPL